MGALVSIEHPKYFEGFSKKARHGGGGGDDAERPAQQHEAGERTAYGGTW